MKTITKKRNLLSILNHSKITYASDLYIIVLSSVNQ